MIDRGWGDLVAVIRRVLDGERDPEALCEPLRFSDRGWGDLVAVIRRVLDGERDLEALCEPLRFDDALIVQTILAGVADPRSLAALLPADRAG